MWMTASSLRPSSQRNRSPVPTTSASRRLAEVPPLLVGAEHVVDHDVGPPGLVQGRDHIRADESGPARDQEHPRPVPFLPSLKVRPSFAPLRTATQLAGSAMDLAEKPKRPLRAALQAGQPARSGLPPAEVDQQVMNTNSAILAPDSPILLIPYMWIGDFVRCHSVVRLLNAALSATGRSTC